MTEKRMTKKDYFTRLHAVVSSSGVPDAPELADFIARELSLLNKKSNAKKGPTKTQLENADTKTAIVGVLNVHTEGLRATELATALDISVQKCSALLRQLVTEGRVTRHEDKKVVTFFSAE